MVALMALCDAREIREESVVEVVSRPSRGILAMSFVFH